MLRRIFTKYREKLRELERQKGLLDTDIGLELESIAADNSKIQCEITESSEGVIVSYYIIDPMNTDSPDVEPEAIKSCFYRRELYYTPEEVAELEEAEEEAEEIAEVVPDVQQSNDAPGVFEPSVQPHGIDPSLIAARSQQDKKHPAADDSEESSIVGSGL